VWQVLQNVRVGVSCAIVVTVWHASQRWWAMSSVSCAALGWTGA
jgi:hypothetical protein